MAKILPTAKAIRLDMIGTIHSAFDDLGGLCRLVEWANASPQNLTSFYTQLLPKIIPKAIDATLSDPDGKALTIVVKRFSECEDAIIPDQIVKTILQSHEEDEDGEEADINS